MGFKIVFSSILFWLAVFFLIRLIGITNPPTEISHNWRQSVTCMVARNFEKNSEITHPSIDMGGGKEIAMEFPLFSYIVFLFNKIFGYAHWYGRLINLIVITFGLFSFYRIIKNIFSGQPAFYSTLILSSSLFFSFGRKTMPDTFSVSLVIIGIFFLMRFLQSRKTREEIAFLILMIVFISAGLLSKIPSLALFPLMLPFVMDKEISVSKKILACVSITITLVPLFVWYGYWNSKLLQEGALQLYFPVNFNEGLGLIGEHIKGVLEKFYFSALSGYIAFAVFLCGLVFSIYRREKKLLIVFVSAFAVFFIFMIKSSNFFYFHNYYVLPFVPFMAIIAGFGLMNIKSILARKVILVAMICEALLNQQHDLKAPSKMAYKTGLEAILNKYSAHDEKIILNTGPSPQMLYFANRKGWLLDGPSHVLSDSLFQISSGHYALLVLDKQVETKYNQSEFYEVFSDEHFALLRPKQK